MEPIIFGGQLGANCTHPWVGCINLHYKLPEWVGAEVKWSLRSVNNLSAEADQMDGVSTDRRWWRGAAKGLWFQKNLQYKSVNPKRLWSCFQFSGGLETLVETNLHFSTFTKSWFCSSFWSTTLVRPKGITNVKCLPLAVYPLVCSPDHRHYADPVYCRWQPSATTQKQMKWA